MRKIVLLRYLLIICFLLSAYQLSAQKSVSALDEAEKAYGLGRFEDVDSILSKTVDFLEGQDAVKAYRLLAFSCLQQDQPDLAEKYVVKLLEVDPYYSSYDDSPRFADLVEKLKINKTTMTTASKIAESIEEVPVPVIVITEDMIKTSGAKTVSDLLFMYVPGISKIGSIDDNLAMRGIYGINQETMLILLDGHRMNSASTNAHPLDKSNSIDKIKQIEVLRGPASSLYGNVALTAVVNIITKSGGEVNGGKATFHAGHFNTFGGSMMYGKGNLQTDIMGWASINTSQGEESWIGGAQHYIGGYNSNPPYDFGINIRWDDFKVSLTGNHTKSVPYYNLLELGTFTYNKYGKQYGEKPGASRTTVRCDIDYSHTWNKFTLSASAFAMEEKVLLYNVMGDSVNALILKMLADSLGIKDFRTRGVYQTVEWEDFSFGGSLMGAYNYQLNDMHGSILGGLQYENFFLSYANLQLGGEYDDTRNIKNGYVKDGLEHVLSAFVQLKHNFSKKFIFNGGMRYDHKIRNDNKRLNTWSPRVSLIWLPNENLSIKAGYSYSFVDAAYFYRGSSISFLQSGESLDPEKMQAIQLNANWKIVPKLLTWDFNLFYNIVNDLVYYSASSFNNAGKVTMGGVENILQLTTGKALVNLNFTYQYPFKIVDFSSTAHNLSNVPKFLLNLIASYKILQHPNAGDFSARMNMHVQSSVENLDNDLIKKIQDMMQGRSVLYTTHQPTVAIFGAGIAWQSKFGLGVSVDAYNLFNTKCYYGGQLQGGIPNQGFNMIGTVSYNF